ncbi:MAG: hypothetical protein WC846_00715 [Candidatus Gracilibacteria bacterium]|jgi:hypothetical protein
MSTTTPPPSTSAPDVQLEVATGTYENKEEPILEESKTKYVGTALGNARKAIKAAANVNTTETRAENAEEQRELELVILELRKKLAEREDVILKLRADIKTERKAGIKAGIKIARETEAMVNEIVSRNTENAIRLAYHVLQRELEENNGLFGMLERLTAYEVFLKNVLEILNIKIKIEKE